MKRLNSQNLLIASLLGFSTLFAGFYPLVKAQSEPKLGCQATVDKILQEIRSKGVKWVKFEIDKGVANEGRTGNPTNRTDVLGIILSTSDWNSSRRTSDQTTILYIINNILDSKKLMKSWADRIVANCDNTAIVYFVGYGSDAFMDYYIQSDGTTKLSKCIDRENAPNTLPWGVERC
jgi:hypothetical protein